MTSKLHHAVCDPQFDILHCYKWLCTASRHSVWFTICCFQDKKTVPRLEAQLKRAGKEVIADVFAQYFFVFPVRHWLHNDTIVLRMCAPGSRAGPVPWPAGCDRRCIDGRTQTTIIMRAHCAMRRSSCLCKDWSKAKLVKVSLCAEL